MTHKEALDIFKCLAWHDLRPDEEDIQEAFKVLSDNSVLEDIRKIVNNWNDDENAMILADSIKNVLDKHISGEE